MLQVVVFVHAIELCNHSSGDQAVCFLAIRISSGSKMDSEEIPSRETMVTSVVPSCWYQPWCYFHCITHYFNNVLGNELAVTKKIRAGVLHSSFWPRKDVSILHSAWQSLTWDSSQTAPHLATRFSVHSGESLQKGAVANIWNHSANNNTCNVLWEKAAGMILEEEVGRRKEKAYFAKIPFLKTLNRC